MTDNNNTPIENYTPRDPLPDDETTTTPEPRSAAERLWDRIIHVGLGETTLRVGTGIVSIALVVLVVWVMSSFVLKNQALPTEEPQPTQAPLEVAAAAPTTDKW